MLQNDSPNSGKPYDQEEEPEWASEVELAQLWSWNFDAGFCSMFGIVPPDFETS
jgi:hypothetical protein